MKAKNTIMLPADIDPAGVAELCERLEQATYGAMLTLDGSQVRHVHTPGVQRLCAVVLSAEGRGVLVAWKSVPAVLVTYVRLLGISDVLRFHRSVPEALDRFE